MARPRRWATALLAALTAILLLPVPWLHVVSEDPPGTAWRLDGRLHVNGKAVEPPGTWTWLTVGRPQLVGEVLLERIRGDEPAARDLREGSVVLRPGLSEPSAAAVGLRHAGRDIELGLLVEVRQPLLDGYPEQAIVTSFNGVALSDRQAWEQASRGVGTADAEVTFELRDGQRLTAPGPDLPYGTVRLVDIAPEDLRAGITFRAARLLPQDWFRDLSLGSSHGMMVALTTYAEASGQDLAQGRHVAGTGGISAGGTITPVGSVPAKARAAHRAGADVLFVPATQVHQIDEDELPGMTVVPVSTLDDAIDWLAAPRV